MKKLFALLISAVMVIGMFQMTAFAEAPAETTAETTAEAPAETPAEDAEAAYTQVKVYDGTYGFGDAEITVKTNDDFSIFEITFVCFDEDQVLIGTVEDGVCSVDYDETGFVSGDCQLIWDDAMASENPWESLGEKYTQVKVYDGTYGFGDAEITVKTNDDFSIFEITFVCSDEDQVLIGTVEDGVCSVDYDETGFVSGDCQLIWDDAMASENPWEKLTEYTQVKVYDGTYGFGDVEITVKTDDDFSIFEITFVCFDEDQVLIGTVEDGVCSVDYDETGFVSGDCQLIWDDAMASENPWEPIEE